MKKKLIRKNSIHRAFNILGDYWTQLIVRELFLGTRRFDQFLLHIGLPRGTLSKRLKRLEEAGVVVRSPYSSKPPRYEYFLTRMGMDLYGVAMLAWDVEVSWLKRSKRTEARLPMRLVHKYCNKTFKPVSVCPKCQKDITLKTCSYAAGPGAGWEPGPAPRAHRRAGDRTRFKEKESVIAALFGDRWSALIISTQYFGIHKYDEIQKELSISTNILADRLKWLLANELLEKQKCSDRPARYEYRLTPISRDIYPIALQLMLWADKWLNESNAPPVIVTHECGHQLGAPVTCSNCKERLRAHDVRLV